VVGSVGCVVPAGRVASGPAVAVARPAAGAVVAAAVVAGAGAAAGAGVTAVVGLAGGDALRQPGLARQAEGEHRAAAGRVAGGDVAAVQVGVLQRDRQAEAAAVGTRAGGARLVEPVEDVRQHVLGYARTAVGDLDHHLV